MTDIALRTARPDSPLTEEAIGRLVDAFYAKVRVDPELGPVFNAAIADWGPHLDTMRKFWSSVMLTSGRYKGNTVATHGRVHGIKYKMFKRWLALFDETCRELFADEIAEVFMVKARRIADSLKLALFFRPDRPWPPSEP